MVRIRILKRDELQARTGSTVPYYARLILCASHELHILSGSLGNLSIERIRILKRDELQARTGSTVPYYGSDRLHGSILWIRILKRDELQARTGSTVPYYGSTSLHTSVDWPVPWSGSGS
ncbi:hypothetical protein VNO77_26896 [Canavalia gladiata]|uniref:Uncharacterized protein n=1 Tax=Canavalia gladiata TaxID=3824 RepID=A0AAN9KWT9_CANGL